MPGTQQLNQWSMPADDRNLDRTDSDIEPVEFYGWKSVRLRNELVDLVTVIG